MLHNRRWSHEERSIAALSVMAIGTHAAVAMPHCGSRDDVGVSLVDE